MSSRITPEVVLNAYCQGAFPMGDDRGRIEWYSPDPRAVFDLDQFNISRSLRKTVRRGVFDIRVNTAWAEVVRACGERREGTWISPRIFALYTTLHHAGYVHTVEAWQDGRLVGGLYGVAIGAAFFGESMFHRVTDASKVALVALVERLRQRRYLLLDTQWTTPHLEQFGVLEISRAEYLERLQKALVEPRRFTDEAPETSATPIVPEEL
jgi:leucyl/phenylalanyl-tRNA---protein transferase